MYIHHLELLGHEDDLYLIFKIETIIHIIVCNCATETIPT